MQAQSSEPQPDIDAINIKPNEFALQTRLAFSLTVLGAVISVFTASGPPLPGAYVVGLLLIGVLYTGLGIYGEQLFERPPPTGVVALYFGVQVSLYAVGYMLAGGRGILPIIIVPLVSHAVLLAPHRWLWSAFALWSVVMLVTIGTIGLDYALANALLYAGAVAFGVFVSQIAGRTLEANAAIERLAAELQASNARLNSYVTQVSELAAMRERARLAREVHDTLGHYLTALTVQMEISERLFDVEPETARTAVQQSRTLAAEGLAEVRRSVAALRPSPLEDQPLCEALRRLADEVRERGLLVTFERYGVVRPLVPAVETALYRAAQEALTNVQKHAHASTVQLELTYLPDVTRLRVQDNGVGPSQSAVAGGGLRGLHERATLLGGTLQSGPADVGGFVVELTFPDQVGSTKDGGSVI